MFFGIPSYDSISTDRCLLDNGKSIKGISVIGVGHEAAISLESSKQFRTHTNKEAKLLYAISMGDGGLLYDTLRLGQEWKKKDKNGVPLEFAALEFVINHCCSSTYRTNMSSSLHKLLRDSYFMDLVNAGLVNMDSQNPKGETVLMSTVKRGDIDGARLLLSYGADVTIKSRTGKDCLTIEFDKNTKFSSELAGLLLANGASYSKAFFDKHKDKFNIALNKLVENSKKDLEYHAYRVVHDNISASKQRALP